jgi:hypothetical protein
MTAAGPSSTSDPASTTASRISQTAIGLLLGVVVGSLGGTIVLVLVAIVLAWITVGMFDFVLALILGMAGGILGGTYAGLYGMMHGALVGPVGSLFADRLAYRPRLPHVKRYIALGSLVAVITLAWILWSIQAASPPDSAEVEGMIVVLRSKKHPVRFVVSSEHIPKLLKALTPAARDWHPSKWVGADQLKITYKDGRTATIDMYQTRDRRGAFSVHPDDRPRNWGWVPNYFRGGSDKAMQEAVNEAYEDFKTRNQQ